MGDVALLAVGVPGLDALGDLRSLDPWTAIEQAMDEIWRWVVAHKIETAGVVPAIWLFGRVVTGDWR